MICLCFFLVSCSLFSFLILSSYNVSAADSVIDNVSLSIQVSCTLSSTLNSAHTDIVSNGTYKEDIGSTTLTVTCNDNEGFAIYAAGYTGNEVGGTNSTKLVASSGTDTIDTGLLLNGNSSQWAMKLTTDSNATYPITLASDTNGSFGSYHVVPSAYTKVASRNGITDMGLNAIGATLTTTYRAYASPEQPAGTYNGKVIYTLVHPATEIPLHEETTEAGKICYYPNGGMVLGSMGCQTITASTTNATLLASNFSRDGYGFAGWSTTYDYSDSEGFYGPQEYIEFPAGTYTGQNNGLSLYAHWIKSAGNLQDWTGCPFLQEGAVTALTDQRDNETYAVAKLADGNCWMIENLRLENTAGHNGDGALAQGYGTSITYGNFSGLAAPEALWGIDDTTANSLYSIDGSNNTINIGNSIAGYRFPRYNNMNTPTASSDRPQNPTSNSATNSTTNAGMYSYGNYYTWAAAIADTVHYADGSDHGTTSICPTGWRLPISNQSVTDRSFGALSVALGGPEGGAIADSSSNPTGVVMSSRFRSYPNNFVYSGDVSSSGSGSGRGSYSGYWSSTATTSPNLAYDFGLSSTSVNPSHNYYKSYGRSIRCLFSGS